MNVWGDLRRATLLQPFSTHYQRDLEGRELELRYFRDVAGREVDFVITEVKKPLIAVECKASFGGLDRGIRYFVERFPNVEAWQVSLDAPKQVRTPEGVRVGPAASLLANLV
jgi:hypothetical protein